MWRCRCKALQDQNIQQASETRKPGAGVLNYRMLLVPAVFPQTSLLARTVFHTATSCYKLFSHDFKNHSKWMGWNSFFFFFFFYAEETRHKGAEPHPHTTTNRSSGQGPRLRCVLRAAREISRIELPIFGSSRRAPPRENPPPRESDNPSLYSKVRYIVVKNHQQEPLYHYSPREKFQKKFRWFLPTQQWRAWDWRSFDDYHTFSLSLHLIN